METDNRTRATLCSSLFTWHPSDISCSRKNTLSQMETTFCKY